MSITGLTSAAGDLIRNVRVLTLSEYVRVRTYAAGEPGSRVLENET
jgi:hypothetical protein